MKVCVDWRGKLRESFRRSKKEREVCEEDSR